MGNATYTVGETPSILLNHCRGSVEIVGGSHGTIKVSSGSMPHTTQQEGQLIIEDCDDDLRLEVPRGAAIRVGHADGEVLAQHVASLELGHVGDGIHVSAITGQCSAQHVEGDIRIRDTAQLLVVVARGDVDLGAVRGRCEIEHVDGDLRTRDVGALNLGVVNGDLDLATVREHCRVRLVNGDVLAREVAALSIRTTNGDVEIEEVGDLLELHRVQGDATIRGTRARFGPTQIHGDLDLDVRFHTDSEYRISVDGDVSLTLHPEEHLTLKARVKGDVYGLGPRASNQEVIRAWGTGATTLALAVNGDLHVHGAEQIAAAPVRETIPAAPSAPAIPAAPSAPAIPAAPVLPTTPSAPVADVIGPPPIPAAVSERPPTPEDAALAVLEAVARGELSPEEAENLLAGHASN